jgi:uncharacterized membrane protein YfcA
MLGIGGAIFLVPLLALILHLPIHVAIGTGLITVLATSSVSASTYMKKNLTNIKLAMLLLTVAALGGVAGATLAAFARASLLSGIFGLMMLYAAYSIVTRQPSRLVSQPGRENAASSNPGEGHSTSLSAVYYDNASQQLVSYQVKHLPYGLLAGLLAGIISGLLGIGGGIFIIPIMLSIMRIPVKPTIGTSAFMIGVVAAASAFIYYHRGYIHPLVAGPAAAGVFVGALLGPHLALRIKDIALRYGFAILLFATAILMELRAFDIALPFLGEGQG